MRGMNARSVPELSHMADALGLTQERPESTAVALGVEGQRCSFTPVPSLRSLDQHSDHLARMILNHSLALRATSQLCAT